MTVPRLTALLLVYFVRIQDCLHTKSLEKGRLSTFFFSLSQEFKFRESLPLLFLKFRETKLELNKQLWAGQTQRRPSQIGWPDTWAQSWGPSLSPLNTFDHLDWVFPEFRASLHNAESHSLKVRAQEPLTRRMIKLIFNQPEYLSSLLFSSVTFYYFPSSPAALLLLISKKSIASSPYIFDNAGILGNDKTICLLFNFICIH